MERSNFALRLLPSLHKAAQRIADRENCSLNQLINVALAEKVAILDADYWNETKRAARRSDALELRPRNEPPHEGRELPQDAKTAKSPAKLRTLRAGGH